jgi:hypothetical protein
MLSVLAAWRVSLRRTRADWPIVAAAWLTMLLATTLLAAGPIYSSAVSVAGLRQTLAEASIAAGNVRVSARVPLERVDAVDLRISDELDRVSGTLPAELARFGTADGFALPDQGSDVRDLALPGFAEGLEQHATLVSGAWPVASQASSPRLAGSSGTAVQVAVSDAVADQLRLSAGDRLDLVSRRDAELVLPVTIAAVFRIDHPGDPFWWSDARTIEGLTESDRYRTYGPFLMSRADLLNLAATTGVSLSWRLLPAYAGITIDDVTGLRARLAALPERLRLAAASERPSIDTELPQTLAVASRALLVSGTAMLLLMGQLALLGGYSILLTAGLLIDHRRVETGLLRSRGAGPGQVAGLAVVEGLLIAAPAVALGPWCAVVVLGLFDRVGPLAQVGLSVPLQVTTDAYLAAGVAGVACVALLALPALFSARAFSAEQRSLSRAETRPIAQRLGIDLALLVAAAIALWQLRLYGAPLTRTVQGTLGPDPLLLAAPALGLLAGALVATRLLPRIAEGAEQLLARRRGLVGALGSFQLARRPLRYTRSALMLMLAMSIGVFAVSYATTWTDSQRSQADHQVGADVRVVPSRSARALPAWSLASAYAALPGVEEATPLERYEVQLRRSVRGTLLALDARAVPGMVRFRADQAASPLADLLGPLAAARPTMALATIPDGSTDAIVALAIDVRQVERRAVDPSTGDAVRRGEDSAAFDASASIGVSIALRDSHGLVHRFAGSPVAPDEARTGIAIPFSGPTSVTAGTAVRPDGALELVSLDVSIALPPDLVATDASISVAGMWVRSAGPTPLQLDLGTPRSWRIAWLDPMQAPITLPPTAAHGLGVRIGGAEGGSDPPRELATDGTGNPVTISMQPVAIANLAAGEIPVLVNQQTLEAIALDPDDTFQLNLAGAERALRIVGVVDSFPTTDAASPLVIIDLPTLVILQLQAAHAISPDAGSVTETRQPDEWWLGLAARTEAMDGGTAVADDISRLLVAPPFASASVATAAGRLRSLVSDPVPVGIIGALGLGALAAALFALIGLVVAASVAARQRQTEFALLRALGLSRRQLARWLWLENGSVAMVSLLAGTALGALISWVVLPSVTVTSDGLPPTPPVVVTLPLATIAVLELMAVVALAAVVLVMAAVLRRMGIGNILRLDEE